MKIKNHHLIRRVLTTAALSWLGFGAAPAQAQTGAYTLSSGSASVSSLTETAGTTNESGIFVYGSGALTVSAINISTTGNSSDTSLSDQYGINAGILAGTSESTDTKGTILITGSANTVVTTGSVANGLFATYTGSSVTMLGGSITTSGSNAHGVDATYGGSVTISNVTVRTSNDSSSAVATDYGGGYVTVYGGSILAADTNSSGHSAGVYSTGVITVNNSTVASVTDCGGVIDGANSIILTNTAVTGYAEGIKLWKTSPATGTATVIVNGGSLTASDGDGFYVTGTTGNAAWGTITVLGGATITPGSGNIVNTVSGSRTVFTASAETLAGNFISDSTSTNTILLLNGTTLTGCINAANLLTIDATSTWNATSNSVISATVTNSGIINLTGKLTTTNLLVKSGGEFGGTGFLSSNLTVSAGATLILNPATNFVVGGNVIFGGAVTIVPSTTNITAGTYKLLTYSNSLSGTPSFAYITPAGSGQTAVFSTATAGVITVTISAPLSAPTNLTATAGNAEVTLNWNPAANAAACNIERSLVSGGSYTLVGGTTATNFVNSGLTNGILYYYVITSTNSSGASAVSSQVSARPVSPASTNLTFTASSGILQIDWPSDHTGWRLQAQTNSLAVGLSTNWADVPDATLTNHVSSTIAVTNACVFFRMVYP